MKTSAETKKALRACKFCKHEYLRPCDGKDKTCGNRLYLESQAKPAKIGKKK